MMPVNTGFNTAKKLNREMTARRRLNAILIIDDDHDFLELVSEHVSRIAGTDVETAASCEDAVSRLARRRFQLVICDWALAKRTGPEVFCLADPLLLSARTRSKIPVMFMSGSEKVACTQGLRSFENFEPVTFIIKNLGASMIRVMAENVLLRFSEVHGEDHEDDPEPGETPVYLS